MSQQRHYYEAVRTKYDTFLWKVYRYDSTGNHEVIVAKSHEEYTTRNDAINACVDWMEENDCDAELA